MLAEPIVLDSIKVFRSSKVASFFALLTVLMLQMFFALIYPIVTYAGYTLNSVCFVLFLEMLVVLYLSYILSNVTEKITITRQAVVRRHLFKRQSFSLGLIKRVAVVRAGESGTVLLIETNTSEVQMGFFLTLKHKDEAATFILERMKKNYPESYALIKDEKKLAMEAFWHL